MRRTGAAAGLAALALLLGPAPAAGYVLPPAAIVKKAAERRAALEVTAVEVAGTVELSGAALTRLGPLAPPAGALTLPARLLVKTPGKVRLELQPAGATEAERPFAAVRDDRVRGQGGLEATPAVTALLRAVAVLVAFQPGAEGRALADGLARRGVLLGDEAALGRFGGRLALVLGSRAGPGRPQASFDKETYLPLRLLSQEGGAALDVRLLDWASPTGGDWFPRAVEVWDGPALLVRFTTAKATANPRLAEPLF